MAHRLSAMKESPAMFKHILVPLDGSERAERAAYLAGSIARATGSQLLFLRVVDVPVHVGPYFEPPPAVLAPIEDDVTRAAEYLERLSHQDAFADVAVETMALEGPVAATILEVAVSEGADLVLLCSHGSRTTIQWALGSVAQKLARHACVPTLVLRAEGPVPQVGDQERTLHRALVALDGSSFAERALVPAADLIEGLAYPGQAELHLMRVVVWPEQQQTTSTEEHSLRAQLVAGATSYLRATAERLEQDMLAGRSVRVSWSVAVEPDSAAALIAAEAEPGERAGQPRYDFVAMATHGRSGIQRWALGSVTERILHASHVPLLIIPPASEVATP
jgi:nucleotide-binding universal stress UspA family protein